MVQVAVDLGADPRIAFLQPGQVLVGEAQQGGRLGDSDVGRALAVEEAHLADDVSSAERDLHASVLGGHRDRQFPVDHDEHVVRFFARVGEFVAGRVVKDARHQGGNPGLALAHTLEQRDRLLRGLAEVEGQHVPQGHDPHARRQGRCEDDVDEPCDAQGEGCQDAEFALVLERAGEADGQEAQAQGRAGVGDGPAHRPQGLDHALGLVGEFFGGAVEADQEVDRVVDGDSQHQARNQTRGRVERDAGDAQDSEIDDDGQRVGDQRQESDPERHEEQAQHAVDDDAGQAQAHGLSVGDVVAGFVDEDAVAGHVAGQMRRELVEPRLDGGHQLGHVRGIDGRRAHQDVHGLVARVDEAIDLVVRAEEHQLGDELLGLGNHQLRGIVVVEGPMDELHVVDEGGGAADIGLFLEPALELFDGSEVDRFLEGIAVVRVEHDIDGVRALEVLIDRFEVDAHRTLGIKEAHHVGADVDVGNHGSREDAHHRARRQDRHTSSHGKGTHDSREALESVRPLFLGETLRGRQHAQDRGRERERD